MRKGLRSRLTRLALVLLCAVATLDGEDYLTEGVDNGRTGWLKNEKVFNTTNVQKMRLLWKIEGQQHSTADAQPVRSCIGLGCHDAARRTRAGDIRRCFRRTVCVRCRVGRDGVGEDIRQHLSGRHKGVGSTLCPGGQTAVPIVSATPTQGRYALYALSWDGRLHTLDVATGKELAAPEKFAGPNGKPYALNLFNGVIYTSTAQGCGGNTNAFLSFDLSTKKTSIFAPAGGGMWGRRGVAIDPEGRVFMGTGDAPFVAETNTLGTAVVAVKLDANKQLQFVDYFAPPNANWLFRRDLDLNVSPMAFDYRGRKFLVATSKECRLWLLDRDDLGGSDNRTALQITPLLCNDAQAFDAQGVWGAIAAWQDAIGTSMGRRPVLRSGQPRVQGTRRACAAQRWRGRRLHARGTRRQMAARATVVVARHGSCGARDRRQRRDFHLRQRRGRLTGRPGPSLQ